MTMTENIEQCGMVGWQPFNRKSKCKRPAGHPSVAEDGIGHSIWVTGFDPNLPENRVTGFDPNLPENRVMESGDPRFIGTVSKAEPDYDIEYRMFLVGLHDGLAFFGHDHHIGRFEMDADQWVSLGRPGEISVRVKGVK